VVQAYQTTLMECVVHSCFKWGNTKNLDKHHPAFYGFFNSKTVFTLTFLMKLTIEWFSELLSHEKEMV
jgi:hypothetical protein